MLCLLVGVALAQRPNQGEDESAAFVAEGRDALKRGKLDDAARALDQAISVNPRRVDAYVLRSAVYIARKQYKDGIALMRRAQALAPDDDDVLTALGSDLVLAGDTAAGVPLLQQVATRDPARYDAQLLLAHVWYTTGKWADAIPAFEAYFARRPQALAAGDPEHEVELGDAYLRSRQPKKAIPWFMRAAKTRLNDARPRIGIAWAMAAIDCAKARPLLHDLEIVAEQHPEIWLVDGQCALALGDATAALTLGRRYLDRAPRGSAAGHALVGEAYAARGLLADARKELDVAKRLEPTRRRWTVRLAAVLRRAGQPADALATLEHLGPPAQPAVDPEWWVELGETLLAQGDAQKVVARISPIATELPDHAPLQTVLGAAQLALGQHEAAITSLENAQRAQSTPRSRRLLAEGLLVIATAKLTSGDAADAEPMLARAAQLDGNPQVWRNLGIARLVLDNPTDAIVVLDKAAKADVSPISSMLAARAHALAGEITAARSLYDRALAAEKDNGEIALDWAATELAGGDPAIAVFVLEKTIAAGFTAGADGSVTRGGGAKGPLASRMKTALANARHAAALGQLKIGNGGKAVELLRAALALGETSVARKCDLAVAAVVAGDMGAAVVALRAIQGQSCPFPPPADTQAAPILIAFSEGLNPKRAGKALDRLTALGGKATGASAAMLGTSIRVVALNAAQDAYRNGQLAQARKYLATAKAANARVGSDEVAHNIAVLDLAEGHLDAAIRELERLAPKVPEALVNLGIAYERKGEHARALDAWRRARKAGVRFGPLPEWIDSKERIYGEGAGGGS